MDVLGDSAFLGPLFKGQRRSQKETQHFAEIVLFLFETFFGIFYLDTNGEPHNCGALGLSGTKRKLNSVTSPFRLASPLFDGFSNKHPTSQADSRS